jgi:hypothetical protein
MTAHRATIAPRATTARLRGMSEAEMLQAFYDLEDKAGLGFVFHITDARGQRVVGCPDVIAILPDFVGGCGTVGFFEVKTQRDRTSYRQHDVIEALDACCHVVTGIVRPVPHEGEITLDEALRRLGVELR